MRRRVPRLGQAARSRGRAQSAVVGRAGRVAAGLRGDRGGPAAREHPPSQHGHDLRRRADRRTRRSLDGVRQGPHARTGPPRRPDVHRNGSDAAGRRVVWRCVGGARGRPAARRHQGAERHARQRRKTRADGLRPRARTRGDDGPAYRGRTVARGARSAVGRGRHSAERRVQHRRGAVSALEELVSEIRQ